MFARSVPAWSRWVTNIVHDAASKLARNRPNLGRSNADWKSRNCRGFRTGRSGIGQGAFGTRGASTGQRPFFMGAHVGCVSLDRARG